MVMPACSFLADKKNHIVLPLSKSIAARLLVAIFWSGGCLDCMAIPDCDDSRELRNALRQLQAWRDDPDNSSTEFYLGEGGTSLRFFLPLVASFPGLLADVDCGESLRGRPIAGLVEAIRSLGGNIRWRSDECRPPFLVMGDIIQGGRLELDASVSSQFVSALMLSAPMWRNGLSLCYGGGHAVSTPYIKMTATVMRSMGAHVELTSDGVEVLPGGYSSQGLFEMEEDWSAASYFYEWLLARGEGKVEIASLISASDSIQGDARCAELMAQVGIKTSWKEDGSVELSVDKEKYLKAVHNSKGICWNMKEIPDLVPAFAVGLCQAGIPFSFEGVGHLRHKECNRIAVLADGLRKLGFRVESEEDVLAWNGIMIENPASKEKVEISPCSDHRMAMAFGVVEELHPGMVLLNKEVVSKSFPAFWRELSKLNNKS